MLLILACCFKPSSVQPALWKAQHRHLVRRRGLVWAMNGSLCCSHRFLIVWTAPSPARFQGDTLVQLSQSEVLLIKSTIDTVMILISLRPEYMNTLGLVIHTPYHSNNAAHKSGSCLERLGFSHFMWSRKLILSKWPYMLMLLWHSSGHYSSVYVIWLDPDYYIFCLKKTSMDAVSEEGCLNPENNVSASKL